MSGNQRKLKKAQAKNRSITSAWSQRMTGNRSHTRGFGEHAAMEFPEAGRTAGGHRLYSESEVSRLRWVKSTIDEGNADLPGHQGAAQT